MKNLIIFFIIIFTSNCAIVPLQKIRKKNVSKHVKIKAQDVKTVDLKYSENIKSFSNLKIIRARVSCKESVNVNKKNWRDLLEAGFSCMQEKNWKSLSAIAFKLSHNHLKAPWGSYYKSIVAEQKGDFIKAIWMINLALKKAPENSMILFQKARILWLMKKETISYDMMKRVIALDVKNYDALLFLGNIHYRDREFKKALDFYKKVLKYNYKDKKYRAAMGEANFYLEKYKESIKHYKVASSGVELNASLFYKIGLSYKNLKDWNNAKIYLKKSIEQRRKGRGISSLSDDSIRNNLKIVESKIREIKGKSNEKNK